MELGISNKTVDGHRVIASIDTAMRQLGQWFEVIARYKETWPEHHFAGAISTSLRLLKELQIMEKYNIHFRLEGKEVIVMA